MVKPIEDKTSFVHNCIANKNKSMIGHFENIYNKKVFTDNKYKILKILHNTPSVDFRKLTLIKNALFDCPDMVDNHLVPLSFWKETINFLVGNHLDVCEDLILKEILQGDMINMMKFVDLVDLFLFLPMIKEIDNNDSQNLYRVMSSGITNKHSI